MRLSRMDKNRKNSMPVVRVFVPAIFISVAALDSSEAAVLPEDRTDILYHAYDGGGITIDGPSVLVRKSLGKSLSLTANHYVDSVSSASIDVEVHASSYEEERTEHSLGVDYLIDRTIVSFGHTVSSENDYEASTGYISISQDFFGDLSNFTVGYAQGDDEIFKTGSDVFYAQAKRRNFRLAWSQILTKSWMMVVNFEGVHDEGYLNNPYRFAIADATPDIEDVPAGCLSSIVHDEDSTEVEVASDTGKGYCRRTERYPRTRSSAAVALNTSYYLPWRAALHGEYRKFHDSWDIDAWNVKVGYTLPVTDHLIFDAAFRYYEQTQAKFFFNVMEHDLSELFFGRDKELAAFNSTSLEFGITYEIPFNNLGFLKKGSINFFYNHFNFEYENFTDLRERDVGEGEVVPELGEESLYTFDAGVTRFFISIWY